MQVNFNNFAGRFYVPGPIFHNNQKTNENAAMLSFDFFEFARARSATLLWTEDWCGCAHPCPARSPPPLAVQTSAPCPFYIQVW